VVVNDAVPWLWVLSETVHHRAASVLAELHTTAPFFIAATCRTCGPLASESALKLNPSPGVASAWRSWSIPRSMTPLPSASR